MKLQITDWYIPSLTPFLNDNRNDSNKRGYIDWKCPKCEGQKHNTQQACYPNKPPSVRCKANAENGGQCSHTRCIECSGSGINEHRYFIQIFGITEDNKSCCVTVPDYKPYFYVKPPAEYQETQRLQAKVEQYLATLQSDGSFGGGGEKGKIRRTDWETGEDVIKSFFGISKSISYEIVEHTVEMHYDFKGFQNNCKVPFVKFVAKSERAFRKLIDAFKTQQMIADGWKLYESNIDPFLRSAHERDIKPAGWIEVEEGFYRPNGYTGLMNRTAIDVVAKKKHIKPCNNNTIGNIRIASFDIECNSSHGDFPVEQKDYKKLCEELCDSREAIIARYADTDERLLSFLRRMLRVVLQGGDKEWHGVVFSRVILKDPIDDPERVEAIIDRLLKHHKLLLQFLRGGSSLDLNNLFSKHLPAVAGDPIIQIGTTYSEYGSPDIVRRVIVTHGGCSKSLEAEGIEVIDCATEMDMLMAWRALIQADTPHILTGYNINGFDFRYIYNRLAEQGGFDDATAFLQGLGYNTDRVTPFNEKVVTSSAMGIIKSSFLDMNGILIVDMYSYLCKTETWDSYKLDSVAEIILGENKIDLKPSEMFRKYLGTDEDRADIARYCIQDCALVNRIIHKKKIIENNFGMANVCHVPARYIFTRGQGIKIHSLVAYECRKRGQLIPVLGKDMDEDGKYEGAIVLPPKTGIYIEDPVVVFDYSSLYPSSMIAENLSHDSYIDEGDIAKYVDQEKGCLLPHIVTDSDLELNVVDCGCNICHHFVKSKSGKRSTIPDILDMLIKQRKIKRSMCEYQRVVTTDGAEYVGLVSNGKEINTIAIRDLETTDVWQVNTDAIVTKEDRYNSFEKAVLDALQLAYKVTANSLYGQTGSMVSPIAMVQIAQSTTATGRHMIVRAKEFVESKYAHLNADVIYGDSVMGYTPLFIQSEEPDGDGTGKRCRVTTFDDIGNRYSSAWEPYPQFVKEGDDKQQIANPGFSVWVGDRWANVVRVVRHYTKKRIFRIQTMYGLVDVTEDHSLINTNGECVAPTECSIGTELWHSVPFFHSADADAKSSKDIQDMYVFTDQRSAQQCWLELVSKNIHAYIKTDDTYYIVRAEKNVMHHIDNMCIQNIIPIHNDYTGYVYDIETEAGVFHAGIGALIVKNTDSIFCRFDLYDENNKRVHGKAAIPSAIKLGQVIEKDIYDNLLVRYKPQKLNYEKVLSPFILFSKKRYTGLLYEDDPNKYKHKSMGIVLKRRDNANIVKEVYGDIINKILIDNDLPASFQTLQNWLEKIVAGDIPIQSLIITKKLKAKYANPTANPHKVLADRMFKRDPGNSPAVNDRVPFVYIVADDVPVEKDTPLKNSMMVEHPEYITEHSLRPNYLHYITNQIMNPILQLYTLCIDEIPNYDLDPAFWERERCRVIEAKSSKDQDCGEEAIYKRLQDLKEKKVRDLLFTPYINRLGGTVSRNDIGGVLQSISNTTNMDKPYQVLSMEGDGGMTAKDMKIKVTKSVKNEVLTVEVNKKKVGDPLPLTSNKVDVVINTIKGMLQTDEYANGMVRIEVKGCAEIVKHWITLTDTFCVDRTSNMWVACVNRASASSVIFEKLKEDIHRIRIY